MNTQAFLVIVTFLAAASLALGAGIPNAAAPAAKNSPPAVNQNAVLPSNPSVQVPPPGPVKEAGAPDDLSADATFGLLGYGLGYYGGYGGWGYGRGWGYPYGGSYYGGWGGYGRPYYGGWGGWGRYY